MPKKSQKSPSQQYHGFTIVELLIVIVIIAILAAITLVAYNGIQDRAKGATTDSDISNTDKIIKLYQTTNGTLPSSIADFRAAGGATIADKMTDDYGDVKKGEYYVKVNEYNDNIQGTHRIVSFNLYYYNYSKKQWWVKSWVADDVPDADPDDHAPGVYDSMVCNSSGELKDCGISIDT